MQVCNLFQFNRYTEIMSNIRLWLNILKMAQSINGLRQYIFYLSNLDVYRLIEYSNTLRILGNIESQRQILDLGTGYSILPLLCKDLRTVDINKKACSWQKKNCSSEPIIADFCNLPFKSNCVDVVTAISSIEHVPDDRKVYSEINRILKDGGCLIMSVPYSSKESNLVRGLRKGFSVNLLNSKYLEKLWVAVLSKDNFYYFKEQTQTDFLNKVYGKDELFSIIKEENWEIEEEIIFGKKPFQYFFKIFPPGWFVLKDLAFGYILHKLDNTLESEDGNTILLKLIKGRKN